MATISSLNSAFATIQDNSKPVPIIVDGKTTDIVINILPLYDPKAFERLAGKVGLKTLAKYEAFFNALTADPTTDVTDYFDTLDDVKVFKSHVAASHIVGWNIDDVPCEFNAIVENMALQPEFTEVILSAAEKLAGEKTEAAATTKDSKKKSANTSNGKSSGQNTQ